MQSRPSIILSSKANPCLDTYHAWHKFLQQIPHPWGNCKKSREYISSNDILVLTLINVDQISYLVHMEIPCPSDLSRMPEKLAGFNTALLVTSLLGWLSNSAPHETNHHLAAIQRSYMTIFPSQQHLPDLQIGHCVAQRGQPTPETILSEHTV